MTPQDQVKAIAELDGWLDVKEYIYQYSYAGESGELKQVQGRSPSDLAKLQILKPYLTSRDAIVPVIEKYRNYAGDIMDYLQDILERNPDQDVSMDAWYALTATPQQLAEALLRATGKWKE